MPETTVLFLHGLHSTPGGVKPTYLRECGFNVLNPHLPDEDFDESVRIAQEIYDDYRPTTVIGSSRGGAVAVNLEADEAKLILLCPAWKHYGDATTVKPGTVIIHSRGDEVVPYSDSEELVRNSGLPGSTLLNIGADHRLAEREPLEAMAREVV